MMNAEKLGGASRPRRRRVLKLGAVIFLAGILLIAIRESNALVSVDIWDSPAQELTQPDSVYARELLEAVRGANGILCGAIDRTFDTGSWSHSLTSIIETDFADQRSADVARWIGSGRFDESVLPIARAAMRSEDACVRRMAARIAGETTSRDVHQQLRAELSDANARVRTAAVFAIGFADRAEAIPVLRERLSDSDRNVRVAAIWALGSIGDDSVNDTMVNLLERDADPVVRSAAAWALGRIND
ncbi:MAG TPA: HEAT repeat domain-containing protein [Longimicrobiales bacterium]